MANTQTQVGQVRLIAFPELTRITTLRKTALYELIKAGELRPVKLGRKTVFAEAEVIDWVNKRLASRGAYSWLPQKTTPSGVGSSAVFKHTFRVQRGELPTAWSLPVKITLIRGIYGDRPGAVSPFHFSG